MDSDLLQRYQETASERNTDEVSKRYAKDVIKAVAGLENRLNNRQVYIERGILGFKASAQRLELQSHEFLTER